jgi:TetR/AcrR family transcriptional regulator
MAREEILKTAFLAFSKQGYESVSLRQLATACAVSDSLLTHHFGSKQQLWYEACDSVFAPLLGRLATTLDSIEAENIAWKLRLNLKASLVLLATEPDAIAFLFREGEGDDERAEHLRTHYLQPYMQHLRGMFEQAQNLGLMRPVSHEAGSGLVLGLMRMLAIPGLYKHELAAHLDTADTIAAYVDDVVSIFYDGIMYTPSSFSSNPANISASLPAVLPIQPD